MVGKPIGSYIDDEPIVSGATVSDANGDAGGTVGDTPASGIETFDPASGTASAGTGSAGNSGTGSGTGKRRGRPPGSVNRTSAAKTATPRTGDLSGLEGILLSLHFGVSKLADIPELVLDDEQAAEYSKALKNVAALYDTKLDPKFLAWTQLLTTMGAIYGGAFMAAKVRSKEKKGPAAVVELPRRNPNAAAPPVAEAPRTPADLFGLGYSAALPE